MTQDETIELARKAGFRVGPSRDGPDDVWGVGENLVRFARLVAEKERDECAKLCDCVYDNIVTYELTDQQIKAIEDMKFEIR